MSVTTQPVTSRNVLDFRGQETVEIEGRSCLTVAFKEHQKALGEFKSNPNAYPLAQMIVAWARYAEQPMAQANPVDIYNRNWAIEDIGHCLLKAVRHTLTPFDRESLKQGILGVMQSQGIDTENL